MPIVELQHRAGMPWVRLAGDVDFAAVADRGRELAFHVSHADVTVELTDVAHIDAAGLAVLLLTVRGADRVRLIDVPPALRARLDVPTGNSVLEVSRPAA